MNLPPMLVLVAVAAAGCQPPQIQKNGAGGYAGEPDDAGGAGGTSAPGGSGSSGNQRDAGFTNAYPDGSAPDVATSAETCAAEVHRGQLVPVDMLFLLDTSGSMEESGGAKSKWMSMREAISSFMKDPQSAGLGVGMLQFPGARKACTKDSECGGAPVICGRKGACSKPADVAKAEVTCYAVSPMCLDGGPCTPFGLCSQSGLRCTATGQPCPGGLAGDTCVARPKYCNDAEKACAAELYDKPVVAIADLPAVQPAIESALAAIVPEGGTPTTPAVQGALAYLRDRAAASGARKQLLVLATDGTPTVCDGNTVETAAAELARARLGTPGIPTYVLGVFTPAQVTAGQMALEQLATAGGTGTPLVLMTGGDLTQKFIDAINQIRGSALGCEFTIPPPAMGTLDFDKVNVRLTSGGTSEDLGYVASADRCDMTRGGWYYDIDPAKGTPTRVLLCDASCGKTGTAKESSVELRFGCKTIVIR
jgi:Mg-chelatase subunit ChlD